MKPTKTGADVAAKPAEAQPATASVGEQPPTDSGQPPVAGGPQAAVGDSQSATGGQQSPVSGKTSPCGCCRGRAAETPALVFNRPGLSVIAYRVGAHAQFKQSMLAALSTSKRPALRGLGTREDSDFSIALLDAWATVADVLTFYQERIANESYLRTATERRSLLELARLTGYELSPGVAASTHLAFTVDESPGSRGEAVVDIGTKVQSIPGQDEKAQTFETVEKATVKAEWNAMKPALIEPQSITADTTSVYFRGTKTQLKTGDGILLLRDPEDGSWDFRIVASVKEDTAKDRTEVGWATVPSETTKLASGSALPYETGQDLKFVGMRLRASLFGHNAPTWYVVRLSDTELGYASFGDPGITSGSIDLDTVYPTVGVGTRVVLVGTKVPSKSETVVASSQATVSFCKADSVTSPSRADYGLSGRVTRIESDTGLADGFLLRTTTVYIETEQLELADEPMAASGDLASNCQAGILSPVCGDRIEIDRQVFGLVPGKQLMVSGKHPRVKLAAAASGLLLTADDGSTRPLDTEAVYYAVALPAEDPSGSGRVEWQLMDKEGSRGRVVANSGLILLASAEKEDGVISELAALKPADTTVVGPSVLVLAKELVNVYDRESATIFANVLRATHGESVREVLGSGDAGQPYQSFELKQSPLTHVAAANPAGAETTLAVRVNDVLWHHVPHLYGRAADERVYVSRIGDDGVVTVEFGDGESGARVATGRENATATYRKGIGLAGNVRAGQLTALMTRPLGVKAVTNPCPAEGAEDPETRDQARQTVPAKLLTLDRAVSLQDYEDLARTFAGIAKALASGIRIGERSAVVLTVAGPQGAGMDESGETAAALRKALRDYGDPYASVLIRSYRPSTFRLAASVLVADDYLWDKVRPQVEAALLSAFSFEARRFGQWVALSEVVAIMQNVAGVAAVDVKLFDRDGIGEVQDPLPADLPREGAGAGVQGAELLTIDPKRLVLTEMAEAAK